MAVVKNTGYFSKTGKGIAQVSLLNFDGTPKLDSKGVQEVGNEQFVCEQLSDDSISSESVEAFVADVVEATSGDLERMSKSFREGWNRVTRLEAGTEDPYVKAAKRIHELKLPNYKGMSVSEIAEDLKSKNQ